MGEFKLTMETVDDDVTASEDMADILQHVQSQLLEGYTKGHLSTASYCRGYWELTTS